MNLQIKRIYAAKGPEDGYRVLVDRLWPRGIKKEEAGLDSWAKEIAPSTDLRKRFAHEAERFTDFRTDYRAELDGNPESDRFVRSCKEALQSQNVTLLYAAKDETCSNASVLCEWLRQKIS